MEFLLNICQSSRDELLCVKKEPVKSNMNKQPREIKDNCGIKASRVELKSR